MKRNFTLEYWLEEGWYVGRLREVPGVFSQGETMEELIRNVEKAYHMILEDTLPPINENTMTVDIELEV